MKKRMIERLNLLAEIGEAKWLQEIVRHTKTLDTRPPNSAGCSRPIRRRNCGESWRSGSVLEAGAAKRAANFVSASARAEQQIEQTERQAHQQLELARQGFAQAQERRHGLEAAKQARHRPCGGAHNRPAAGARAAAEISEAMALQMTMRSHQAQASEPGFKPRLQAGPVTQARLGFEWKMFALTAHHLTGDSRE